MSGRKQKSASIKKGSRNGSIIESFRSDSRREINEAFAQINSLIENTNDASRSKLERSARSDKAKKMLEENDLQMQDWRID